MDTLMFTIIAMIMVFVVFKNVTMFKRVKHNDNYIGCYKAMLNEEEGARELIVKTIEEEPLAEFKNKTRLFEIYTSLDDEEKLNKCLENLDLREIFYEKGQLSKQKVTMNSDSFLWVILDMMKAKKDGRPEVIDELCKRVLSMSELSNRLEYKMVEAVGANLKDSKEGIQLFKDLLEGNTYQYAHDRQMIGIYKRTAAAMLDINNETYDEFYQQDLYNYATTLIGNSMMKLLGNYDKYHKEENSAETENTNKED